MTMSHRSVATQTHWSWLKDLEEIARLKREHVGEVNLEMGSIQQMLDEEQSIRNPDLATGDFGCADNDRDLSLRRRDTQISHKLRDKEEVTMGENEKAANVKTLTLPSIVNESEDKPKKPQHTEELVLPSVIPVANPEVVETDNSEEADTIPESVKAVSLSSIEQLEQLTFPFFEDKAAAEDSNGDSDTEKASDKAEDDEQDSSQSISPVPPAPRLKVDNLSWPSILQYMRESESLASDYFSLNNKEAIESRLAHNKRLQQRVTSAEAERLKSYQIMSSSGEERDSESDSMAARGQICDFCGQNTTQISLLQLAEDQDSQMALCCEEKKEFCVLMAVCMRQMITRLKQEKPKKISVELTKKAVKKTAEEKALEMMRRQQKWEELRRRKEEIQQQTKLPKHVQLIQFSLLSAPEGEWMVRPESAMKHQTPNQKQESLRREKATKKKEQEQLRKGILLPRTIERLKQLQCEQPPCEHKVLNYGNEKKFAILLPDGTGQVYYPSGNLAIIIFTPYIGVLAYLVFEDSNQPCLLAYMDELGRITCYNSQAKIRLVLRQSEGFLYDGEDCQSCRKHWRWSSGEASVFQPFILSLNKQLTAKLNSHEKFLLTFCGSKLNHIRFDVESKLKDDKMLSREIGSVQLAQSYLGLVKNRISQLLQLLKQNSRSSMPRKHSVTEGALVRSDWHSIYSTKTLVRGQARSRTNEMAGHGQRRRTKSTGGLTPQKSPIKIKPLV